MPRKKSRSSRKSRMGDMKSRNHWRRVDQETVVTIPLSYSTVVSSGTAGDILFAGVFDPSSAGFNSDEFAPASDLYTQIKFLGARVQMVPLTDATFETKTNFGSLTYGVSKNQAAPPSSHANVIDNGAWHGTDLNGRKWRYLPSSWNPGTDKSTRGVEVFIDYPGLKWSPTSLVAVTDDTGCPGTFAIFGDGFPVSTPILRLTFCGLYAFRNKT